MILKIYLCYFPFMQDLWEQKGEKTLHMWETNVDGFKQKAKL